MLDMLKNIDTMKDGFDSMNARSDQALNHIKEAYDKDGNNDLDKDELWQAVLDGTVPTLIADAGASASCGQPLISDCGMYTLDNNPFIATGQKLDDIFCHGTRQHRASRQHQTSALQNQTSSKQSSYGDRNQAQFP